MTHVICEPCIDTKDRACIDACPVDCIHPREEDDEGETQVYIDPDTCIDCGACEPECPVEAIFDESEVPDEWSNFTKLNYEFFGQQYTGKFKTPIF